MAVNSAASRSQDQLHIHVACVAPKVTEFLRRHRAEIHDVPISSERDFKGLMKGSSVSMDTCISRDSPDSRCPRGSTVLKKQARRNKAQGIFHLPRLPISLLFQTFFNPMKVPGMVLDLGQRQKDRRAICA
jgi:hypothetical protein